MWLFAEIRNLPDIIRHWAKKTPGKTALKQGERSRTYEALDRRSSRIAQALVSQGIPPGSHVGYVGKNAIEFFELWFASTKAGSCIAPLNWRCTAVELAVLVADADLRLIFVDKEFMGAMRAVQAGCAHPIELVPFDSGSENDDPEFEAWITRFEAIDPRISVLPGDTALLAYTSGTTGKPKGVRIPHEAFNHNWLIQYLEPAMQYRPDDTYLMVMPNFHLAGSFLTLPALYNNGTISIMPALDTSLFLKRITTDRPTMTALVPTAIQMLLDHPDVEHADFSSLRTVLYAGSPIGAALLKRALRRFGCDFAQFYGTTETWIISLLRPEHHDVENEEKLKSCGKPMPLIEVKIVDGNNLPVEDGDVGELLIRTPTIFSGYWNQPAATDSVLLDGWYRTGDLGRRDSEGFLYLVDRAKDMIVSGGENIYSTEIEQALLRYPNVALAAVIGLPDERWGERVAAFIVPAKGATLDANDVARHCRALIAAYKVPKSIEFVDSLPMTPSGKIQKRALRDRYWKESGRYIG